MKIKKIIGLAIITAALLLTSLTACTMEDLQKYQGILKNVDSLTGNVTVALNDGTTMSFNLADIDLQAVKDNLGNISIDTGDNVTIVRDRGGRVRQMGLYFGEAEGTITDITGGNITIATEENGDITLTVTADTLIIQKATGTIALSDLQIGQKVEAKYNTDTLQAVKLKVDFINRGKYGDAYQNVTGNIAALDSGNATVTINTNDGTSVTLRVTAGTIITIRGDGLAAFTGLKTGQQVTAKYDPANMEAMGINAGGQAQIKNQEHHQVKVKSQGHGKNQVQNRAHEQNREG